MAHSPRTPARLAVASALAFAVPILAATPTNLSGGTTTVNIPAGETTPAFTFTNTTGVPICDLVVSRAVGGFEIAGCVVDDPQHTDEDWDADDDENGSLSTGAGNESSAPPGAGPTDEGGGGNALNHADNNQPTPDGKIRLQENGADADSESKCVGNNRNFQVTCKLSAAAQAGDSLRIQPTNVRDANLCAFADGLLGQNEKCAIAPDHTITPAFAAFGRDNGYVTSLKVTATGIGGTALLLDLESVPKGAVDLRHGTITFDPPLDASRGLRIYGLLNDYADVEIAVQGKRVQPAPVEPAERP